MTFKTELELALMGQAALVLYCNELWFEARGHAGKWADASTHIRRDVAPYCTHLGTDGKPFRDNHQLCHACRSA